MLTTDRKTAGRKPMHPLEFIRIRLCGCKMTDPLKAVTFDGGRHWEVIAKDPIWRGCEVQKNDVAVVRGAM